MLSTSRNVTFTQDPAANAATIRFGPMPPPGEIVDVPVELQESVAAVLTFSRSGRLVELELLAADRQLPDWVADES